MFNAARSLRGLLFLSGLILMVHTLVPHVHGVHLDTPGQASILPDTPAPNGWLDVLADLVDTDMGEDHLEHFSTEKAMDLTSLVPAFAPALTPALFGQYFNFKHRVAGLRSSAAESPGFALKEAYLRRISPRGPPAVA